MIEAGANEVPEDTMIEAIYKAHDVNQEIIRFIDKIVAECGQRETSLRFLRSSGRTVRGDQEDRSVRRDGRSCLHRR